MNFFTAIKLQIDYGHLIKRKVDHNFGIIMSKGIYSKRQIIKFVSVEDQYPLSLEDILAEDWETKELE